MSLKQFSQKIKSQIVWMMLMVILVIFNALMIYLISKMGSSDNIHISRTQDVNFNTNIDVNNDQKYQNIAKNNNKNATVASKNGKKYYFLHCSGTKSIKEENKVYFDNQTHAEKAGYTIASGCKPLP